MTAFKDFLGRLWSVVSTLRALLISVLVLAITYVTAIDSSLVPWDSILGLFVEEAKIPSAVATATAAFGLFRWVAPTIINGLRYLFNKRKEAAGSGLVDVPEEDCGADEPASETKES